MECIYGNGEWLITTISSCSKLILFLDENDQEEEGLVEYGNHMNNTWSNLKKKL